MLEIKIDGMAELEKALGELPVKLERNVMRGALRAGAKVIADEARRKAPRDDGDLQKSIRVSSRVVRGQPTVTVKAGGAKKGEYDVFYAHMVERGTTAHFIKPKKAKSLFFAGLAHKVAKHPGAKKHPFMRPALDTKAGAALEAVKAYIRKRLTKEGISIPDSSPPDSE